MPIVRLDKLSLRFGLRPLLEEVDLQIHRRERLCLIGRNGEGKSSLLRLIAGEIQPDGGTVWVRPGVRIGVLGQEIGVQPWATVAEAVREGLCAAAGGLESWEAQQRVERTLADLKLDGAAAMDSLSGGWRRRAMLGRALVSDPDLLLLDEPTNHLDIEAIGWLEEFILQFPKALLFVSHDREFVRRVANRIIELDRGVLSSWPGSYDDYRVRKRESLAVEARRAALFDKRLQLEEAWIRQGVEARRTRNEGRVRALEQLRIERRRRRERPGQMQASLQDAQLSGKLVFEADNVGHDFDGRAVVRNFSARIMRGDRIGIIGPNGCGKSTLIKLLLGDLAPTRGTIRRGTSLNTAYFDQQRDQLDPSRSIADNVTGGSGDTVQINGSARHVSGYLRDFLFSPERLKAPVAMLSGGERNRVLLARLFARPANLLVLDEPTNDLDAETLDLLEELIADFSGTLLLVSHDRAFLDDVVTSCLVFEGGGSIKEYVGGYSDWVRQRTPRAPPARAQSPPAPKPAAVPGPRKRSFKDQHELKSMPDLIERLEKELAGLQSRVNAPEFYRQPAERVAEELRQLESLAQRLEVAYRRWQELEELAS